MIGLGTKQQGHDSHTALDIELRLPRSSTEGLKALLQLRKQVELERSTMR